MSWTLVVRFMRWPPRLQQSVVAVQRRRWAVLAGVPRAVAGSGGVRCGFEGAAGLDRDEVRLEPSPPDGGGHGGQHRFGRQPAVQQQDLDQLPGVPAASPCWPRAAAQNAS